jgi:serine/threonine-protein kinase
MAIGTPAYMAPEQLAADPAADHRIDLYAVGLLAYELLSGQSPFVGTSPQQTLAAQLTRVPESLDTIRDDVPPALAAVIMRCLEKLPEHRPQTADALLEELDGAVTPPGGTGASIAIASKVEPAPSSSRLQRRALLAGGLLIVLAGAAVALGTWRRTTGAGTGGSGTGSAATVVAGSTPAAATAPGVAVGGGGAASAAATARLPGDSAIRTPIVLTRAESLAIADAVRKRVTAQRDSQIAKGQRAQTESLTVRLERALSDTLARMVAGMREGRRVEIRGFDPKEIEKIRDMSRMAGGTPNQPGDRRPPPGAGPGSELFRVAPTPPFPSASAFPPPAPGVRRVLVGAARTPTSRRDVAALGLAIADSLRRAIAARPGYDVVDAAAVGDPRMTGSRSRSSLARMVGAGAAVSALYYPRADSLWFLQLQVFDVQRNRVVQVLESKPIDVRDPMRDLGELVAGTLAALEGVDWRPPIADSVLLKPAPTKPD